MMDIASHNSIHFGLKRGKGQKTVKWKIITTKSVHELRDQEMEIVLSLGIFNTNDAYRI